MRKYINKIPGTSSEMKYKKKKMHYAELVISSVKY